MDPVTMIIVPGFLGGLVIAVFVVARQRRSSHNPSVVMPLRRDPLSTDIINMASIKVAGVGGLGLVAMAAAVALDIPRIGQVVSLGLVLGAIGAAIVIWRRRETGPMPSSGKGLGANTTLAIDPPSPSATARQAPPAATARQARSRVVRSLVVRSSFARRAWPGLS